MVYARQLLSLGALTLFSFALYVLMFWAGAAAGISILFYRGIVLALLVAAVTGLAGFWFGRRIADTSLPIAAAVLSFSFNICFLVVFPVTVDRSVTVYLLSTIERHDQSGIDTVELQREFVDGYVVQMRAMDRRIDEQRKSGNVSVAADGKIHLTAQGQRFMQFSRIVARLFGTDPRFVRSKPRGSA